MRYSVQTLTEPPVEPLTLAQARAHLKIPDDITVEDDLISAWIATARQWVENYCRRSIVQRTLVLRMDYFPCEILLPYGKVQSVESVEYLDSSGSEATFAAGNYQADIHSEPARIVLESGATWPTVKLGAINAAIVTYVAGYEPGEGSPTDYVENIPDAILAALKLLITHLERHRGDTSEQMPESVKQLLAPYEIRDFTLE